MRCVGQASEGDVNRDMHSCVESQKQDQGAQRLRSGAELGIFEEEKAGQSGWGHGEWGAET